MGEVFSTARDDRSASPPQPMSPTNPTEPLNPAMFQAYKDCTAAARTMFKIKAGADNKAQFECHFPHNLTMTRSGEVLLHMDAVSYQAAMLATLKQLECDVSHTNIINGPWQVQCQFRKNWKPFVGKTTESILNNVNKSAFEIWKSTRTD